MVITGEGKVCIIIVGSVFEYLANKSRISDNAFCILYTKIREQNCHEILNRYQFV